MSTQPVVLDGETLTCAALRRSGAEDCTVSIKDSKWPRIEACRKLVDKFAAEETVIYGINTSCGGLVDHLLPKERESEFQKNLIRCVATQVGDFFPDKVVRETMIARVNSLCRGYSGIKRENLEILLQMINKGVYPCIGEQGSLGTSGDLGPLASIALVSIGEWKARYKGKVMPAAEAMQAAGIPLMKLQCKEGLSLINGTSCMAALASYNVVTGRNLVFNTDIICALTYECLFARIDPFNVAVHELKYHPGQYATANNIGKLLKGSKLTIDDKDLSNSLQKLIKGNDNIKVADIPMEDAYSIRCCPHFVGPIRDTLQYAEDTVTRELNSSNDNPLIFVDEQTYFHNGHFHGQYLSTVMDMVAMSTSNITVLADRLVDRLFVKDTSVGLPPFLSVGSPGVNMGLMGGQFMTASLAAENRTMLTPASCQSISTTGAFQDIVSFGLIAGRKAKKIIKNGEYALGFLAMCAAQAAEVRGVEKLSPAGKVLFDAIRETTSFQKDGNRCYMDDLEALAQKVHSGEWVQRVTDAVGPLMWVDDQPQRARLPPDMTA